MTVYTFGRLLPGATEVHEAGPYRDRATAETQGRREMVASCRVGGVVIEHSGGPAEVGRVVSVATGHEFTPFDGENLDVLTWWHSLAEDVRLKFTSGESFAGDALLRAVGEPAVMCSSIGGGPYVAKLSPAYEDFVGAIVGEDAPWLEGAPLNIFGP